MGRSHFGILPAVAHHCRHRLECRRDPFQKLAATTVAATFPLVTLGDIGRARTRRLLPGRGRAASRASSCPRLDQGSRRSGSSGPTGRSPPFIGVLDPRPRRSSPCGSPRPPLDPLAVARRDDLHSRYQGLARPRDRPARQHRASRFWHIWHASAARSAVRGAARVPCSSGRFIPATSCCGRVRPQRFTLLAGGLSAHWRRMPCLLSGSANHRCQRTWKCLPGLAADERRDPAADAQRRELAHAGRSTAGWRSSSGLIVAAIVVAGLRTQSPPPGRGRAWRSPRSRPSSSPIQALVGGLQILTDLLAAWTQTLHVALGAIIWALISSALATVSYLEARTAPARSG